MTVRVGLRCDAGPRVGAGHLMRCLALAEELLARGVEVIVLGELGGLGWARGQLEARRLALLPGPAEPGHLAAMAGRLGLAAMVLDSYELAPESGAALRAAGVTVLAVVDGDTRGQDADLYLDQNLGATGGGPGRLSGLRYVLLRDAVRRMRPAAPRPARPVAVPSVLCFFGGTDAGGVAPRVAELLVATGSPFAATVVAARPQTGWALRAISLGRGQSLAVQEPTDALPRLVTEADVVVSAAGTSVWELLCLGAPAALVPVAGNQMAGYAATVDAGLAVGLGPVAGLAGLAGAERAAGLAGAERAAALARLTGLLTRPELRAELSARGHAAVDGRGRERVADALLAAACRDG